MDKIPLLSGPDSSELDLLEQQLAHAVLRQRLLADGLLIVGVQRPPPTPLGQAPQETGQVFLRVETEGIEVMEMVGIIHHLMWDLNKHFSTVGLDPPFPQAPERGRPESPVRRSDTSDGSAGPYTKPAGS